MPSTRARIDASTTTPLDKCLRRSGTTVAATGARVLSARGATGAELLESLSCARHLVDDLCIAFTPRPGAGHVPGCEQRHCRELHESSLASSLRRLSEEMPALPAARPARPPATTPALRALPCGRPALIAWREPTPGRDLIPLGRPNLVPLDWPNLIAVGTSSESATVSTSRCSLLFLLSNLILGLPFVHRVGRDAFAIASTSSLLVMDVRFSMPMLSASSTSSGLL